MSEITPEMVRHVASLARLAIHDDEIQAYSQALSNIFTLVEQMDISSTEGQTPTPSLISSKEMLRPDEVTASPVDTHPLEKLAPQSLMGLYLVPQVIE